MNEETRAELVKWLDPEGIITKSEILGDEPQLSYLITYACKSLWISAHEFAAEEGLDSDEIADEAACIITEHILRLVVDNDYFGGVKDVLCRHLMGVLAKELLNG